MSAVEFWNASTEQELLERNLTPYSPSTEARLDEYRQAFDNGKDRFERWTLYPKGVPTSVLCRFSGIAMTGHPHAMLVEVLPFSRVELLDSELRALEALRHTSLMISLFSNSGRVLMRNPGAAACFRELDKALPAEADHLAAMFANSSDLEILIGKAEQEITGRHDAVMALEGSPIHAINLMLVSDPVTGDSARLVTQEDISKIIHVNRQLAASEEALDAVLNINVAPVVILASRDSRVLNANFAAHELFGAGTARGDAGADLFVNKNKFATLRESILSRRAGTRQAQLRGSNGAIFWAVLAGVRISYEKQDAIAILVTNIDEIYRATEELEAALSLERTVGAMQRRFLAIASHEFRTPLALIDSTAQRLARSSANMSPDQVRAAAQRIRNTVKRLLQLLEKIFDRARENQPVLGYDPTEANLAELITRVVRHFQESNPSLEVKINLPIMPPLLLDITLMEQVFANLLSNVIKYAVGQPRAEIGAALTSEDVQIVVRDWGIGVPEEERSRIFSDYVRGSNVGSTQGTGLGLSIVNQIVGLHGGVIDIIEHEGPGLMMKISLPRADI